MGRRHFEELEKKRPFWTKESAWARSVSARKLRRVTRSRLKAGRDDDLPRPRRTEGWMTW